MPVLDKASHPPAARISVVEIHFEKHIARNPDGTDGLVEYRASFDLRTESADGSPNRSVDGELQQHLTATQKTWLKNLIDSLHTRATAEVL